jgi:hypothetical protein
MNHIITIIIFSFFGSGALGQNLIGLNDSEIKKYMKENYRDMSLNNVTNNRFYYLKYSDNSDSQTLLFFLDRDSVCNSVRLICEPDMKARKVNEFNKIYMKNSNNTWIDRKDGRDFLVSITDEEWSCVITIEPAK